MIWMWRHFKNIFCLWQKYFDALLFKAAAAAADENNDVDDDDEEQW